MMDMSAGERMLRTQIALELQEVFSAHPVLVDIDLHLVPAPGVGLAVVEIGGGDLLCLRRCELEALAAGSELDDLNVVSAEVADAGRALMRWEALTLRAHPHAQVRAALAAGDVQHPCEVMVVGAAGPAGFAAATTDLHGDEHPQGMSELRQRRPIKLAAV